MGYCWLTTLKRCNSNLLHTSLRQRSRHWTPNSGEDAKRSVVSPGQCLLTHKAAITQIKLTDLLKHPVYSPVLAPSNHHLFPNLKKHIKGNKYSTTEDTTSAADDWFADQPSGFHLDGLKKLTQQSRK
jgi:hypothetical protein